MTALGERAQPVQLNHSPHRTQHELLTTQRVLSTQAWCPHHERSPLIICSSDLTTTRTLTCRGLGPNGGRLFEKTDDISTEPDVQTDSDVGETAFCAVGLTLGLLGVAVGTFFLIKGNKCN
ncbi:UNVERIFIED_CONTAM: hypothetical protein FKN15_070379 [Acipenser sinensis]